MKQTSRISRMYLLICLTLVVTAQGNFIQHNYNQVEDGESLIGTLRGKYAEQSHFDCSLRCSMDSQCIAYQFDGSKKENCGVIHGNSTEESGREFTSEDGDNIFRKEQVTACTTDPCQNNGTCVDGINTFNCLCIEGFTGERCEINIDDCDGGEVCQNGGTCHDGVNILSCECQEGFTGERCETNIDDCDGGEVCRNGGTCQDGVNILSCECQEGFTGERCETNIDDCDGGEVCQNGGTCHDGVNILSCECQEGFTGDRCETDVDDCDAVVCMNSGVCLDGINYFTCNCMDGFTGEICQTNIDECDGIICENGRMCHDALSSYTCECACGFSGRNCGMQVKWIQPSGWSGSDPVFYSTLDNMNCFILMQGTSQINFEALVPGKLNSAVSIDKTKKQWIDLGIHTEACMTRPETCGAAGGAISLWMSFTNCTSHGAIITTQKDASTTGFNVHCPDAHENMGYQLFVSDGHFIQYVSDPHSGWFRVVLNFLGPNDGEGIQVYHDGVPGTGGTVKHSPTSFHSADGRIVIGRAYTGLDNFYGSFKVDALLFFNRSLSPTQIASLAGQY